MLVAVASGLAVGLLLSPLSPVGAQEARVPRIGFLTPTPSQFSPLSTTVWLKVLGYHEGRTAVFVRRFVTGGEGQLARHAVELVQQEVDVIVAAGSAAARAARDATTMIPIVMVTDDHPARAGLVATPDRPEANVTGVTAHIPNAVRRRLGLLKEAAPRITRVAVLWNPGRADTLDDWREVQAAAAALDLELVSLEVRSPADLDAVLGAARPEAVDGLLVMADPLFVQRVREIGQWAARGGLPSMYPWSWFLEAHDRTGLLAFGPSTLDLARRAADYVDRILKGTEPRDLPVAQLPRFELVVDLRTARALGLTVPASVLIRADRVLE